MLRKFDRAIASLYLAASMGLFANLIFGNETEARNDNLFLISWLVLYVVTITRLLTLKPTIYRADALCFYLALTPIISSLWSVDVGTSLNYSIAFFCNLAFCMYLRARFTFAELLNITRNTIAIMIGLSLIFSTFGFDTVRYVDIHQRDTMLGTDPIRGFFNHKITAGFYAALGAILSLKIERQALRTTAVAFHIIFVLLTGSSSALALCALGLASYGLFFRARKQQIGPSTFIAFVFIILFSCAAGFALLSGPILEFLGRDPTLTGRTLLWGVGTKAAEENLLLGWGYQAYLSSEHSRDLLRYIPQFANYDVPHFHNSYIQVLVDLGGLTLAILALTTLFTLRKLYGFAKTSASDTIPALAVFFTISISAVFVFSIYNHNNFSSILFFSIILFSSNSLKFRNHTEETHGTQSLVITRPCPPAAALSIKPL
ncbi:O-antigen ligase family protein [Halopseudomonas xinjiangensis]|uniref:O-antigen ligase family protein n=1 Tax=Halopseudomonas xinjiangensis TaxID=487184 RepID=UPI000B8912E1|nr:O-antigen ligase family protein [Halopseudomonas xinjiangensis]